MLEKCSALYTSDIKLPYMTSNNNTKKELNAFTIRADKKMTDMLEYLKGKKNINKTAIIKLAVSEMYNQEILKNGDE